MSVMRKLCFIAVLLLVSALIIGCSIDKSVESSTGALFESIRARDYEKALGFYSPKFFEKTPREELLRALIAINTKLGDLQTYKIVNWKSTKTIGTGDNGTYWTLECDVSYSKYPASETITFFKPTAGSDFKIVGHNINSKGFLQ